MRPFLFIGNFKMNPVTPVEVEQYRVLLEREGAGKSWSHVTGVLCPSLLHISFFQNLTVNFALGAQHGFPEKSGAYTGEVSFAMLKSSGVEYVLIGHSERRQFFGETEEAVRIRTEAALKFLLQPVVCIGETESERQAGETEKVLTLQVNSVFSGLSNMAAEKIIFAYEPCWAIGTGVTPTSLEIQAVRTFLHALFTESLGEAGAKRILVVYGGSVKASNLQEVAFTTGMDGVLVGKESLSPYEVVKMMDLAEKERIRITQE